MLVFNKMLNLPSREKTINLPILLTLCFFFSVADYSLDLYKRVVAFVMAYSFTEGPGSTSMMPMADILNHHSDNNAHLIFEEDFLKMKSFKKIEKVNV